MAQEDTQQEFVFQEVTEALHEERLHRLWHQYKFWLVGGLIAFFLALTLFVLVRDYKVSQDEKASDLYITALQAEKKGNTTLADQELDKLINSHSDHGYALLAHLHRAKLLAQKGDTQSALDQLEKMAKQGGTGPWKDLAMLNAAYMTSGDAKTSAIYLKRISEPSAFSAHGYELKGLLALQQEQAEDALTHFQKALQFSPPKDLENRLMMRIERLGGLEALQAAQLVQSAMPPKEAK
uniref:Ancillary SecYEG translocon subunit n=1 Tax=Magnetococcus massalia (strain MO-1) TaxID=451514 RepID=A0A1S7LKR9_MAGMO|nr:conserved hypothetical protein. Containing tetratricopeptide TPR_2 repeat domain [Candidatus Magnetococcus massalia]